MGGYPDGTFKPKNPITRAETVVTLDRALGDAPSEEEPEPAVESAVEGVVTFNDKPVANAVINIFKAGSYEVLEDTKTDSQGLYKIKLEPGEYDITAIGKDAVGYASKVKVTDGKVTKVDFALKDAAEISGVLKDKNGKVVKKATVLFTTNPTFITETDNDGEFSVLVLPDKTYTVRAYKPGEEDKKPEVVEEELKVGKAGEYDIGTLKASFAVSSSGGGGGGGSSDGKTVTEKNVGNLDELQSALDNTNIKTINFTADIDGNITVSRLVNLNFGSYKLTGNVTIDTTDPGSMSISGSAEHSIGGKLTVIAPNATITNKVKVKGEVIIRAIGSETWNEEADGNNLDVQITEGVINIKGNAEKVTITSGGEGLIINVSSSGKVETLKVDDTASIKIEGEITSAEINAPVKVQGADKVQSATIASVGVVLDKEPQEFEAKIPVTIGEDTVKTAEWRDTNLVGTNTIDGKSYVFQGFELLDGDERIELVEGNIEKITVLEPGATDTKDLTVVGDRDPYLWFNVMKATGKYKYIVVKDGITYVAKLEWTAPEEVTATPEGEPKYNKDLGATYQKYNVEGVNLLEFDAMYQIKPVSGSISELKPSGDNCLWFKVDSDDKNWKQEEGDHIFLVKHGTKWSMFKINYKAEDEQYHVYKFEIEDKAAKYIVRKGLTNPSDEDFKDMIPVKLRIVGAEEKGKDYDGKVRVAPVGADGLQLWAKDTKSNWYDINQAGWGPAEGFVIDPELVTPVYVIATKPFNGTVTLKLIDITGDYGAGDGIIISQEVKVEAVENQ